MNRKRPPPAPTRTCRLCGASWPDLPGVMEWHKPGCRLLNPATGATDPEQPRTAHGDNTGITLRSVPRA